MRLTLLEILEATRGGQVGGTLVGNSFSTFHTDSRTVQQGGVFFALRGAETDGHLFAPDAARRGASALVVERALEPIHGVVQVVVPDAWQALNDLAAFVLARIKPLVVGITGSNGKTSTKEMTAAVLAARYNVLRTMGNLNTETGVPLTVLGLEPGHTALVLEMGMQRAGDIGRLVQLTKPSVGIITNVGAVHMEFFATQQELARAKGELVAGLPVDGRAILWADDQFFPLLSAMTAAPTSSFGLGAGEYRVESYRPTSTGGCQFAIRSTDVKLAMGGRHQALNAAAALAAAESVGIPIEQGAQLLSAVAVAHRMQEIEAPGGFIVVDDSYNASPESMVAAFEVLTERPKSGRLLAVLGEMRELGPLAEESHQRVGKAAAGVFDKVAVIDSRLGRILAGAVNGELLLDNPSAEEWVRAHARPGDRVLIKGSHSLRLDEVVARLAR